MSADALLSRLDRVRRTGDGKWVASCPSHSDKNPSLAIREMSDGRLLVHCFAGCDIAEVITAVGMRLSDLMPERAMVYRAKGERRPFLPADVFEVARCEISICALIACDIHSHRDVTEDDYQRLLVAVGRLNNIAEIAYGQ